MLSAVLLVAALAGTAGTASATIRTGVYDLFTYPSSTQRAEALLKTRQAGSNLAKSLIYWRNIETSPGTYNWSVPDAFVNAAKAKNLEPVLTVFQAPSWASGSRVSRNGYDGVNNVSASKLHDFAVALATRYKNDVNYYEAWNEPNLPWFFTPQIKDGKFVSPARYRALVNAFASGIHQADPTAVVIAGNTAPFGHPPPSGQSIGPKPFLKGVVSQKVRFDAWSTHPYTYGGPTHHANKDSDVSLGDMGELRKMLNKARRSGKILGAHRPQLWASEFSWDSKGPDSRGVPMSRLSRWISETVYRLNKSGVNALLWFGLRDRPFYNIQTQSGFWFCGTAEVDVGQSAPCGSGSFNLSNDVQKPIFNAFRFPFVAYAGGGKVKVWGKRPGGVGGPIDIWRKKPTGNWSKVTTINPGANFSKTFNSSWTKGFYKAVLTQPNPDIASVPFSLTRVGDKAALPFGCLSTPTCDKNGR